ncbi:hypothetical protein DY000_02001146, partial [Brassica cretica]
IDIYCLVCRYRAANAGKFPTLKVTVKEVGGGYYVVRDILQELKLRPNAPLSRVPASNTNDASSLKQDHTIESSHHPSSDEVSLQEDNNLVITATHDRSETETTSLNKDVYSKYDGSTHLREIQTLKVSEECLKTKEEGTLTQIASQEPRADHLQGANVLPTGTSYQYNVITATLEKGETKPAPPSNDVDSICDDSPHLPESQTLKVAEECLKNSQTTDEGTLTQLVSPEPKADQLQEADVLPATHLKGESETALLINDVDSKCDGSTLLPDSQQSMLSEECLKNSETKEEGKLTHLGIEEPKAEDCHEGGAASANVLPTETRYLLHKPRQVPEEGDGEVKTGENASAWSNIVSFAKGFANFWRKG